MEERSHYRLRKFGQLYNKGIQNSAQSKQGILDSLSLRVKYKSKPMQKWDLNGIKGEIASEFV